MKLGLENISRLLRLAGDPQEHFPAVLVAGTNGKGSVTAFLSSMLEARGFRVGAFYSPHLFRINERIKVDGEEISSPDLDGTIAVLRRLHDEVPFTYFEGMTAAAAIHFERKSVDIAVFEVGQDLIDEGVHGAARLDHEHDLARALERGDELLDRLGAEPVP